jgi:predicted nucleic acid-binding protein
LTLYLDTSVLISALTPEPASERTRDWLGRQTTGDLVISDWVVAEVSSALAIKLRTNAINEAQRANALATFKALTEKSLAILPVERGHFIAAARLVDQAALGLRAADALHLAIAIDHGARLCTRDQRLGAAAIQLGAEAELI